MKRNIGPYYYTDSASKEKFKYTLEKKWYPVKVTDSFSFIFPGNFFHKISVKKNNKYRTVQVEPINEFPLNIMLMIRGLSFKRRKKKLKSYVLCECGAPLNDVSNDHFVENYSAIGIYTYECMSCGKKTTFNYGIAPSPIKWDLVKGRPASEGRTLEQWILDNGEPDVVFRESNTGEFLSLDEIRLKILPYTRNEVLKDSVSTRLYTDDAKYDIYQLEMI